MNSNVIKEATYLVKSNLQSDMYKKVYKKACKKIKCNVMVFTILWVLSGTAFAADPIDMKGTNIRGSSELPKILYIVPWKKAELGDILMQAGISMFDDELAPVDRDVFRRQVQYYDILSEQEQKNTATANTAKK
jgi:hypothetical protein